jgi:hypothetical protein
VNVRCCFPAQRALNANLINAVSEMKTLARNTASLFRHARRSGHKGDWMTFCALAQSGKAGWTLRLAAWLLRPFAFGRYFLAVRREPFSDSVLIFNRSSRQPILREVT